jgi:hypothetical protein
MPQPARRLVRRPLALPTLVALVLGVLGLAAIRPAPASPVPSPGVAASADGPASARARAVRAFPRLYSRDLALGIVIGYAFADGKIAGGTYTYDQGGVGLGDQFRAGILDAGGVVVPHGQFAASSSGLPDLGMVTHGPLTAAVLQGSADLRRGVLTGIVQCEGSPAGLVWDNPSRQVSESVLALLATFGIAAKLRGTTFFDIVVGPESFAFFQSLPVAVHERVPGFTG